MSRKIKKVFSGEVRRKNDHQGDKPTAPGFGGFGRMWSMEEVGKILASRMHGPYKKSKKIYDYDISDYLTIEPGEVYISYTDPYSAREALSILKKLESAHGVRLLVKHARKWFLSPIGMTKLRSLWLDGGLE